MAITWGSEFGNSSCYYGKLGAEITLTSTDTQVKVTAKAYYWSKFSVDDPLNTFYYDWDSYADTSMGTKTIYHTSNSAWDSSNITYLGTFTKTYAKGNSAQTGYFSLRCIDIDYGGGGGTFATTFTIPALAHYTLTFNPNGGTLPNPGTNLYSSTNKANSVTVIFSTGNYWSMVNDIPTRTGYDFKGWYTAASGGTQVYGSDGKCITGTTWWDDNRKWKYNGNLTVYAQWTAYTYTVSYNANGGSGAPANQTKTYGASLTLSQTKPTRTGYTFAGWNTKKDGSGTSYSAGGVYKTNAAVTLYAQWEIITYAVTFDANGGSGEPDPQTKIYGKTLTLSTTIPVLKGYKFVSWNTMSDGSGKTYLSGADYTANAVVTLYAIWKKQDDIYVNVGGTYKLGQAAVNIDGIYVKGYVRVNVNGVWRKGEE